jgi:hypothetical protein
MRMRWAGYEARIEEIGLRTVFHKEPFGGPKSSFYHESLTPCLSLNSCNFFLQFWYRDISCTSF